MADVTRFTAAPEGGRGRRLDQALMEALGARPPAARDGDGIEGGEDFEAPAPAPLSREAVKKAVQQGLCTVNGRVCTQPSTRLRAGDAVVFTAPPEADACAPEEGPLSVLWHDDDLMVLAKPAGITVHPCPSCPGGTLIQRVVAAFPDVAAMGGQRPGIVHRLDRETSGLMLVARTERARLAMTAAFAERRVSKTYLALTGGRPGTGSVRAPIGRDPRRRTRMAVVPPQQGGREAWTEYETLWTDDAAAVSLARLTIHTGRTHQIRVHMTSLGHPLLGDALYCEGPRRRLADLAPRVMLHAWRLAFAHPFTNEELVFTLPPPADFQACLAGLARRTQCLVLTGNPGCGKSTVLALFARGGCPCVSADELVAGYYGPGGAMSAWIAARLGPEALARNGSVDRGVLMTALEERPSFRRELETQAHALVRGDVQAFFDRARSERRVRCCAEIPLYFECGWHRGGFSPAPLSIGVSAGLERRRERLAASRGWTDAKTAAIEGWQWPEERKLAACDMVVDNAAGPEDLARRFEDGLVPGLDAILRREENAFARRMEEFWGARARMERDGEGCDIVMDRSERHGT